ncbi:hypothetical protein FB451DRAFT_1391915 [Mycena latifolia]|nr:hypothetical protein FB451DRAFT_1391915 [Mycena latifolia]
MLTTHCAVRVIAPYCLSTSLGIVVAAVKQLPAVPRVGPQRKQINDTSSPLVLIDNPKYEDWLDENLIVLSCIRLRIGTTDLRLIKDEIIAKKAWDALRAAHQPSGALSQLTILQQALATRYSRDVTLAKTTEKLDTLVDSFFAIKPPTEDEWRCIILFNAMAGAEFANAQSSLNTLLSAGTLSSIAVAARINHEQVRIDAENAETAKNEASFAAFTKQCEAQGRTAKSYPNGQGPCENPLCTGSAKKYHDWDHCYGPGGCIKPPKGKGKKPRKAQVKVAVADESSDKSDEKAAFASDASGYTHLALNKPDVLATLILYLDTGATSSICPVPPKVTYEN